MRKNAGGHSRFYRFFRNNGVFVALAVSLLAVGGVLAVTLGKEIVSQQPVETPVEQIVTNQPDDRTTTTTEAPTTTTAEAEETDALYVLPLTNTVQKVFSVTEPLYSDTMADWRVHTGTDFAGEEGQEVKAITDGTVESIQSDPLWGEVLIIDHGVGVKSRYCVISASVAVGDTVELCDVIGTLAEVPCESAQPSHLHFEMLVDGQPVDPVSAIALEVRYAETTE